MDALQIDTGNGEYGKTWRSDSSCKIYHKKRRHRLCNARSILHQKHSSRLSHYHISMMISRKKKKEGQDIGQGRGGGRTGKSRHMDHTRARQSRQEKKKEIIIPSHQGRVVTSSIHYFEDSQPTQLRGITRQTLHSPLRKSFSLKLSIFTFLLSRPCSQARIFFFVPSQSTTTPT